MLKLCYHSKVEAELKLIYLLRTSFYKTVWAEREVSDLPSEGRRLESRLWHQAHIEAVKITMNKVGKPISSQNNKLSSYRRGKMSFF